MGARALLLAMFLSGCAGAGSEIVTNEGNFITFSHPFTQAAEEEARKIGADLCQMRKQAAVRTEHVCSLTRCTTTYQCMDGDDAVKYRR